jgi:hypothetical protein
MTTTGGDNGDWQEMKRLVIAKMDDHGDRLQSLSETVDKLHTHVAILCDREDRQQQAAKSTAIKWGSGIGAVVSAIVSAAVALVKE